MRQWTVHQHPLAKMHPNCPLRQFLEALLPAVRQLELLAHGLLVGLVIEAAVDGIQAQLMQILASPAERATPEGHLHAHAGLDQGRAVGREHDVLLLLELAPHRMAAELTTRQARMSREREVGVRAALLVQLVVVIVQEVSDDENAVVLQQLNFLRRRRLNLAEMQRDAALAAGSLASAESFHPPPLRDAAPECFGTGEVHGADVSAVLDAEVSNFLRFLPLRFTVFAAQGAEDELDRDGRVGNHLRDRFDNSLERKAAVNVQVRSEANLSTDGVVGDQVFDVVLGEELQILDGLHERNELIGDGSHIRREVTAAREAVFAVGGNGATLQPGNQSTVRHCAGLPEKLGGLPKLLGEGRKRLGEGLKTRLSCEPHHITVAQDAIEVRVVNDVGVLGNPEAIDFVHSGHSNS